MHAKEAFANMLGSEHQTPKHTILLVTQWLQHFKEQTNYMSITQCECACIPVCQHFQKTAS